MKWTVVCLAGSMLAFAGCDSDVVRFDPQTAPRANDAGLAVVLERFRKDTATADVWIEMTNTSTSPITLKAPPGATMWAKAFAADQQAEVEAIRWRNSAESDEVTGGASEKELGDAYVLRAGATREIELRCRLPRPLATSHEPWKVVLFIADHGTIELPVVDPQVASTQPAERR